MPWTGPMQGISIHAVRTAGACTFIRQNRATGYWTAGNPAASPRGLPSWFSRRICPGWLKPLPGSVKPARTRISTVILASSISASRSSRPKKSSIRTALVSPWMMMTGTGWWISSTKSCTRPALPEKAAETRPGRVIPVAVFSHNSRGGFRAAPPRGSTAKVLYGFSRN